MSHHSGHRVGRLIELGTRAAYADDVPRLRRVMGVIDRLSQWGPDYGGGGMLRDFLQEEGDPNFSPSVHEEVLRARVAGMEERLGRAAQDPARALQRRELAAFSCGDLVDLVLGPMRRWDEADQICRKALSLTADPRRADRTRQRMADVEEGRRTGAWPFRYRAPSVASDGGPVWRWVSRRIGGGRTVRLRAAAPWTCLVASAWRAYPAWAHAVAEEGPGIGRFECLCGRAATAHTDSPGVIELRHVVGEEGGQPSSEMGRT